ncbi:hypothetical protein DAD186_02280 [Dermabacter vaginalis]|uniref:Uncharacterized protein n=1 Tax=Dermabacter vaginalis TaxID=1630135 RepID=A0A1B0ZFR4_9MICO|nr:hypothetical protein DAD186_02280 [Dermabacter vaginalis]
MSIRLSRPMTREIQDALTTKLGQPKIVSVVCHESAVEQGRCIVVLPRASI